MHRAATLSTFAALLFATGCVSDPDPRTLWTRSNTLPVDVVAGVELKRVPTEQEKKQLITQVELDASALMKSPGIDAVIDAALKTYKDRMKPEQTPVGRENVKIVIEDEHVDEPGVRDLLFIFRLCHRDNTVEERVASARLKVRLAVGEVTASPRDAIEFPANFKTAIADELTRIGLRAAQKLGLAAGAG